jgi:hypothetical protein
MAHIFFTLVLIILPFLSVSQKKKVTECYNTYNHSLELKNPKMAYTKISTSSKRRQESMNTLFTQNNDLSNENALMKEKIKKLSSIIVEKEAHLQESKKRKL